MFRDLYRVVCTNAEFQDYSMDVAAAGSKQVFCNAVLSWTVAGFHGTLLVVIIALLGFFWSGHAGGSSGP